MNDQQYMELALKLAASAKGRTSPNPLVGAVIVKNQRIVGMGAHLRAGKEHAEIHALNMAGRDAEGGTMYVTLEPCNHYGKTPPCTEAVIGSGIRRVYIAAVDPNPQISGKGVKALEDAGIEVQVGLLQAAATRLNEVYNKYVRTKIPFVILKTAMTLDGKIASSVGDSQWITNELSRRHVHQMRNQVDGIMVGIGTVIADNPLLTTRLPEGGRNPVRIIIDSRLSIMETANVLNVQEAPMIIICTHDRDVEKEQSLKEMGVQVFVSKSTDGRVDMKDCLRWLGEIGITSVMVEGGSDLQGSFLVDNLFDKIVTFIAPKILGGAKAVPAFGGTGYQYVAQAAELIDLNIELLEGDICVTGYPKERAK